jgi:hypothetical protein
VKARSIAVHKYPAGEGAARFAKLDREATEECLAARRALRQGGAAADVGM